MVTGRACDTYPVSRRALLTGSIAGITALSGCLVRGTDSGLAGEIRIDGSDTVLPHSAAIAEEFQWRNNRVRIPISGSGTGAGFQKYCVGETDIQNASRSIQDSEQSTCRTNGIDFVELQIVRDGIAVFVNPANDWCDCLTVEELGQIWESGSSVETWRDIRPDDPAFPEEEIELFGRDTASGTFDYFTEAVTGEVANVRNDYSASPDTNVIVRGVRGDEHALGFGGASYYYENEDDLKLLGVDDGSGCTKPTRSNVEANTYQPLSREMYMYIKPSELTREEVRAFTRFFFESIDQETLDRAVEHGYADPTDDLTWTQWAARRVGYFALPDETVTTSRNKLEAAIEEVQ